MWFFKSGASRFLGMLAVVVFVCSPVSGQRVLADYDAEVRGADGRVNVPVLVQRLRELKVNAYFFLIWHQETDWEDLQQFLPEAHKQGIDVWVYAVFYPCLCAVDAHPDAGDSSEADVLAPDVLSRDRPGIYAGIW